MLSYHMRWLRVVINTVGTFFIAALSALIITHLMPVIDNSQTTLLFLLVVIGVGIYFGAGQSCVEALLCFCAEEFLVLHRDVHSFPSDIPRRDWATLVIFCGAGIITGSLSSMNRERTQQALKRQSEVTLLFEASETIGKEVDTNGAVTVVSDLLLRLCRAPKSLVWKVDQDLQNGLLVVGDPDFVSDGERSAMTILASAAAKHRTVIGFDKSSAMLWRKGASDTTATDNTDYEIDGAFVPLITERHLIGVLYVASRLDKEPFNELEQRLILTLANNVAFVLERESLYEDAAMATALRQSDILKDSLLSMVSHELRSPLAAIKATASAAELEQNPHESLVAIIEEADRLTEIVGNLLDLSRLEAGAWLPEKDWCDIGEIVATALDQLPDDDSARVSVTSIGTVPLVNVDYIQITLVLKNIIQNAIKYVPGDSKILVTIAPDHNGFDERPTGVSVRVRDFGAGIAPNEIDKIFERFFRSRTTKHNGISGTGLGLALVKAIITAHGGNVWASRPGVEPGSDDTRGTVFTIVLPVE